MASESTAISEQAEASVCIQRRVDAEVQAIAGGLVLDGASGWAGAATAQTA